MSGEPYIIPRHPDFWDDNTQADMISLFRPIIDLNTNAVLGVVEIQMLFRQIELICNSQDLDEATALLFAPDDELVYSSTYYDMISPPEAYAGYLGGDLGKIMRSQNPDSLETELILCSKLNYGFKLLTAFPERAFMAPLYSFRSILLLMVALLFLITLAFSGILSRELYNPLKRLRRTMDMASLENIQLRNQNRASNEIDQFNRSFELMFDRLNHSIEELKASKDYEARAQMLALQSQVNPHFIHNTLSVVASIGNELGDARIADICGALSSMLHYSGSYANRNVTLHDEIVHWNTIFR